MEAGRSAVNQAESEFGLDWQLDIHHEPEWCTEWRAGTVDITSLCMTPLITMELNENSLFVWELFLTTCLNSVLQIDVLSTEYLVLLTPR